MFALVAFVYNLLTHLSYNNNNFIKGSKLNDAGYILKNSICADTRTHTKPANNSRSLDKCPVNFSFWPAKA